MCLYIHLGVAAPGTNTSDKEYIAAVSVGNSAIPSCLVRVGVLHRSVSEAFVPLCLMAYQQYT